jgi:hypothetical protein
MTVAEFVPLQFVQYPVAEMRRRADAFYTEMSRRRNAQETIGRDHDLHLS